MLKQATKENAGLSVSVNNDNDLTLMARISEGDQTAFRYLIERHTGRALAFMQRMLTHRQDAEDEVQKAFLKVWHEAPRWRPEAKFSTWLYRVLMNQALDHLRARRTHSDIDDIAVADASPNAEERLLSQGRASAVQKALASLPDRQRQAIILCHYEELGQKEAAKLLNVSEGALESLLSRGRAALRQAISREWYN